MTRYRHAAGFTRKHLAFKSGISERTIIKYETGGAERAKDATLLAICAALGITQEQLLAPPTPPERPIEIPPIPPPGKGFPWRRLAIYSSVVAVLITVWSVIWGPFSPSGENYGEFEWAAVDEDETHSTIYASRFYAEGLENLKRLYRDEARESFRAVLRHDSTQAMAYVMLLHPNIRGTMEETRALIKKARGYEDRLNPSEVLFLDALEALAHREVDAATDKLEQLVQMNPRQTEAYRILAELYTDTREFPKAIGCLNAAITADTLDGRSYNRLAYVYLSLGKYDKALEAVATYLKLEPAEPNPYDTRGDILAKMGRIDEAITFYKMALERKSNFSPSLQNLGHVFLTKGDYDTAAEYYRKLGKVGDRDARCRSSLFLACIPMFEGRLEKALKRLEHCAGADPHGLKSGDNCLSNETLKAEVLLEKGREQEALRKFESALDIHGKTLGDEFLRRPIPRVRLLAAVDLDRARRFLQELKEKIDRNPAGREYKYWYCRGYIELQENNPEAAIESLKRADESTDLFYVHYQLALAYLNAGRPNKAVETFETAIRSHTDDRVRFGLWNAKARYFCGLALLETGDEAGAEAKFTEFLDMWSEADWGFEELASARIHVTRLSLKQRTADRGN